MDVRARQSDLALDQPEAPTAGTLTVAELRDQLLDLQRAILAQMLELGPDPATLALMSGIGATQEVIEEYQ